jgi:hypothetical protein
MSTQPTIAIIMCVRNEATFLKANLAFHHAMGVTRAYVFIDRCTDNSAQIAASFPWVKAIELPRLPEYKFMRLQHMRCMNLALEMAREEGIDWLLHLDPDEFACGDERMEPVRWLSQTLPNPLLATPEQAGSLPAMLARVSPETEQVMLPTREVVPVHRGEDEPFWKWHYFQVHGALPRDLLAPKTGEIRHLNEWFGHNLGKAIVRTAIDAQGYSPHEWEHRIDLPDRPVTDPPRALKTEWRGFHYHFPVVSHVHWWHKYHKQAEEPPIWSSTNKPVEFPVQAWKEGAPMMSLAEAKAYYERWIVTPRHRLLGSLLRGQIVQDTTLDVVLTRAFADERPKAPVTVITESAT